MSHCRLSLLLLLCVPVSLLSIQFPSVRLAALSFDVQFIKFGYDPQMVLFHPMSPKNLTDADRQPYRCHRKKQVLPRQKRKKFVADRCDDFSRIDGVLYARPAPLRVKATTDEQVASFKMTLCLKLDREAAMEKHRCGRIGLFLFLVPYPWNAHDERIEVPLDSNCTDSLLMDSIGGSDQPPVVCAHVQYDSTQELLLSTVRIGDGSCMCAMKLGRSGMPKEAAVGFGSSTGDPIKLGNILTWAFHSTLDSEKDHPLITTLTRQPQDTDAGSWIEGEQRLRVDPWNRNAELSLVNLRYQQNWLHNFQLTCSISVSVGYGNPA